MGAPTVVLSKKACDILWCFWKYAAPEPDKDDITVIGRWTLVGWAGTSVVASVLARPSLAQNARADTLHLVPSTSPVSLDLVFSTALVAVQHGYYVFDTLYGVNGLFPQTAHRADLKGVLGGSVRYPWNAANPTEDATDGHGSSITRLDALNGACITADQSHCSNRGSQPGVSRPPPSTKRRSQAAARPPSSGCQRDNRAASASAP